MSRLTDEQLEEIAQRDIAYRRGDGDFASSPEWAQAVEDRNALLRHIGATMPRPVTSEEELAALASGAIVRDASGHAHTKLGPGKWYETGVEGYGQDHHIELPALVIYMPEE